MDILNLKYRPIYIDKIASWHHEEWGLNSRKTLSDRTQELERHLDEGVIPSTFVAEVNSEVVGTASLVESDMNTHVDLMPWLASVYVDPKHRKNGYGSLLVKKVIDAARTTNFTEIYLYTDTKRAFYERLDWKAIRAENYRGIKVTIMKFDL